MTDPEWVSLSIYTETRLIRVNNYNVTAQAVYSKLRELWRYDESIPTPLIAHPFPMTALTPVLFEMMDGWRIENPEVLNFDTFTMERGILANELKEVI